MTPVKLSDEQVKKNMINHMYWSNKVDASDISVTVDDKVVTLEGEVESLRMRADAENLAYDIEGVYRVQNELDVVPESTMEMPGDEEIRNRVEGILSWDSDIDFEHITLDVTSGVVTLKGSVDEKWKVTYALSKVGELKGVIDVINELTVVPDLDIGDEAIADNLMNAFERHGSINPDPLEVRVEDGDVYLEGAVANLSEESAVYETTIETPGVQRIINNMVVKTQP